MSSTATIEALNTTALAILNRTPGDSGYFQRHIEASAFFFNAYLASGKTPEEAKELAAIRIDIIRENS